MNNLQKLAMMQLADSFFPAGSFTLSHGLETLIQNHKIQSASELQTFIQLLLSHKLATTDIVALVHSHRASNSNDLDAMREADRRLYVQTATALNRETQRQSGRALLMVANSTWQDPQLKVLQQESAQGKIHCLHPMIFGVVSAIADIPEEDAVLAFSHSLVSSILSAAIRLGAIGHLQAQQVLLQLAPTIDLVYLKAQSLDLAEMYSGTPAIDFAQMQHANLSQRLFAN